MNDLKVAVLGGEEITKAALIKNITKNVKNVEFNGMRSGIDIGYTISNGKRVYLFGASSKERKRFFEEVLPAGIDLGIVIVDSSKGISKKDKDVIAFFAVHYACVMAKCIQFSGFVGNFDVFWQVFRDAIVYFLSKEKVFHLLGKL